MRMGILEQTKQMCVFLFDEIPLKTNFINYTENNRN